MTAPRHTLSPVEARRRFLELYLADYEAGVAGELGEYELLFPGCEDVLAEEYARIHDDSAPVPDQDDGTETVGHYRLIRELARGGSGVLCLAHDTRQNRRVAVRMLTGMPSCSRLNRIRMRWDAKAASKLGHPGLARVYAVGEDAGVPYVVMPYTEGLSLAAILTAARAGYRLQSFATLTPERGGPRGMNTGFRGPATQRAIFSAVRGIERAARALHVAHENGLVHRAIQPANILMGEDGQPVILDFGTARVVPHDPAAIPYMAPEVLARRSADSRADVYSLGVTLYEYLTLMLPFEAVSREQLYREVTQLQPSDPRAYNPHLPEDLGTALGGALQARRHHRYPSALAFAEDLERVRHCHSVDATPATGALGRVMRWCRERPPTRMLRRMRRASG